jgi:hypothetical protein
MISVTCHLGNRRGPAVAIRPVMLGTPLRYCELDHEMSLARVRAALAALKSDAAKSAGNARNFGVQR